MKTLLGGRQAWFAQFIGMCVVGVGLCSARADQVRMKNGDSYFGSVVSLDADTLVLQSDVLGTVKLPRAKLAGVAFGVTKGVPLATVPATNQFPSRPATAATNTAPGLASSFQQLGDPKLVQQVRSQFLADAGPEANDKFNQLLGGLISGKLNLNDLRAEAKTAADQVRAVRKDLGDDAGAMVDGYLAILDSFLKETAPPPGSVTTNAPALSAPPKTSAAEDE